MEQAWSLFQSGLRQPHVPVLVAQKTVTAEQFPAIHSVVREEKSAASA
jgi:hypothetical protein